jgi:hypothetical protein
MYRTNCNQVRPMARRGEICPAGQEVFITFR